MFSKDIIECVDKLQVKYKTSKRFIVAQYPIIEILFSSKIKRVAVQLLFIEDKFFEIQIPKYQYYPRISHYDFHIGEKRYARDKNILFMLINDLKYCGLWDYISNKDFIKINDNNNNSDKSKLEKELTNIIEGTSI